MKQFTDQLNKNNSNQSPKLGKGKEKNNKKFCSICKKTNHYSSECRFKKENENKKSQKSKIDSSSIEHENKTLN